MLYTRNLRRFLPSRVPTTCFRFICFAKRKLLPSYW
jgi:hypothetical protein